MKRREIPALSCLDLGGLGSAGQEEHNRNLQRYSSAKKATLSFSNYVISLADNVVTCNDKSGYIPNSSSQLSKIAEKVRGCGDFLWFNVYPGEVHRLVNGFFCKNSLWCVCCAFRRAGRLAKTYLPIIQQQLKDNLNLLPGLLTWTIKNQPNIEACFEHLKRVQRGLLSARRDSLKNVRLRHLSPLRFLHGGVGSYEFKRGKDGGWNLHIHELVLIDRRDWEFTEELVPVKGRQGDPQKYKLIYSCRELSSLLAQELWRHSGDSYILDLRGLYPREKYSRLVSLPSELLSSPVFQLSDTEDGCETASTPDSLFSGLCEAFKYALKFDELSYEDWLEAALSLKGRRLVYSYGCLHGVDVPEDNGDDIEDELRNQPFYQKVYRYYKGSGYVEHHRHSEEDADFPRRDWSGRSSKKSRVRKKDDFLLRETVKQWADEQNKNNNQPF